MAGNRLKRDVKETIDELWDRGIDASRMSSEIERIIDGCRDYDPELDWEYVAERLRLI